ncbi:ABC transporter ATP-binding protein [Salipaludibacillus sp. HK11]|uniref:ABC transporter ATP-binding protein n=1 Tax=Salipaludibacillus sp. HK11 TaxID=3394320 RepID=UPI0039FD85D9
MSKSTITLQNVSKKYGKETALAHVDLSIDHKGIIGVIGLNGSGKSTLLKMIAGLVQPSSGEVLFENQKITRRIGSHIAFLSELDALYSFQTVAQAVKLWDGAIDDFSSDKAHKILQSLNVDTNKKIKTMSKGYRARVKLAVTLARNVPVLIMDEPLSGLDPIVREDILKIIVSNVDLEKQMLILSTHEVSEVEPFLDYVIFLKNGEIVLNEAVETLREDRGLSVIEAMREVLI